MANEVLPGWLREVAADATVMAVCILLVLAYYPMFVDRHKDLLIIKQIQRTNRASGTTFAFWWGQAMSF